ncbi:hypothetical protein AVEN_194860-1 [Araneus ventricosus]|uniref:Uncharacterized protein n=1 Tax=Araneus ventricosus TaxID=182803 RepID=A0A4Y2B3I0_ARAVE|nr:hypothetical protein AVEN_194860-1 [Araneus ventricosus]
MPQGVEQSILDIQRPGKAATSPWQERGKSRTSPKVYYASSCLKSLPPNSILAVISQDSREEQVCEWEYSIPLLIELTFQQASCGRGRENSVFLLITVF